MASRFVDIHPHVISDDVVAYPLAPLFGIRSEWSQERPVTIADMVSAMDEAGVDKAAIVHSSTTYGFDNSYVCEATAQYPKRFTAVGSVDLLEPDAPATIRKWIAKGLTGLRIFTGGSTKEFDTSSLDDPRSFPSWDLCSEEGLPMCIQTGANGLDQVVGLARRFPKVRIILDHLGRPDVTDGPPYSNAASLFALAPVENIYLKLTPRIFSDVKQGAATADTFFPKLVEVFGSQRLAWGSNYPTSEGPLGGNLDKARQALSCLSQDDQAWIFAKTAQTLYPVLAD